MVIKNKCQLLQNYLFPEDCSRLTFNFVSGNSRKEAMFLTYPWPIIIYTGTRKIKIRTLKQMGKHLKEGCLPEWKPGDQLAHSSLSHKGNTERKQRCVFHRASAIYKYFLVQTTVCMDTFLGGWSETVLPVWKYWRRQFTWRRYCIYIYHF